MKEPKSEKNPPIELEEIENYHNTQLAVKPKKVYHSDLDKLYDNIEEMLTDKNHNCASEERVQGDLNEAEDKLPTSLPKVIKKIGKRKKMLTSDITQKKARNWLIKMDETENEKDDEEFKLSDYIEHDKNYFFVHLAEICCKLCSFKGKHIVQHYRTSHPESEVLISRLNLDITEILIEDAIRNREEYESNHPELEKMTCNFKCPFCLILVKDTTNTYYNHISSHTGEYCFHCNHCSYWTYNHANIHSHLNQMHYKIQKTEYKMVYLEPKVSKYVFGYICSECNFIQLVQKTVEEHSMVYHPGVPKIHKVNLGVLLHDDVLGENRTNKIHSNKNCLNLDNSINAIMSDANETHNHNAKIPDKTKELSEKFQREDKEPKIMSEEMEKLNEEVDSPEQSEKAEKFVKVMEIGPISIIKEFNVFRFHCKIQHCNYSSEDKNAFAVHCEIIHKDLVYNFGAGKCNICSIKFEYEGNFVTVYDVYLHIVTMHQDFFEPELTINFKSIKSLISKMKQLASANEDDSGCASVLTAIQMTDPEKQNRKCPKAVAIMMKPQLLNALYKCPKYDCSFATTLPVSFQKHFAAHDSILMDTLVPCLYCDYKIPCSSYVIHLEVRHGHCLFGCGDCFYRTTNSYFITMHRELMHPNTGFNILQLEVVTSSKISADTTPVNLIELVLPYNCKEDGFLNCPFNTLYFDEYLKHVDAIHRVDELGSFLSEQEPQKEAIMEGWLAKEVGPFQCRYCKKATVTHEEMGRHQAVFHSQEQCLFYYRKFVPNDTVMIPEQVNLKDPSFINHVIHLPTQIHLCNFKLMDGLLSSTSAKLTNEMSEVSLPVLPLAKHTETDSDQSGVSLDEPELFSSRVNDEECLIEEPNSMCLDEQPKDESADNDATVTACKLQCKWKDCYRTLHSQTALIKHIKKNHVQLQSGKEFTCFWSNCPRKSKPYKTKATLLSHMMVHTGERPHKCSFQGCNRTFSRILTLDLHQKRHTGERPYLCQFCSKGFFTCSLRNDHQRLHYDPEPFACPVIDCPKKYKEPSGLRYHMKNHTVEKQLEAKSKSVEEKQKADDPVVKKFCKTLQCKWEGCCQQTYESQTAFLKHIEKNHVQLQKGRFTCFWMNCPRKSKPYTVRYSLSRHMRVHTGEKPYKCPFQDCNETFLYLGDLKVHQRKQHTGEHHTVDEQLKVESVENQQKEGCNTLQCEWKDCYQTLLSQAALIKHVQKNHVRLQRGKEFICFWNDCRRKSVPFTVKQCLLRHMNVHTGERPHKCSFQGCNKAFAQLRDLKIHQGKHTEERPFLCQFSNCSKSFSTIYDRNCHQALHYNTVYTCQVTSCLEKYTDSSSLWKHMEKHTVDEQLKVKSVENKQKEDCNTCKWEGCFQTDYSETTLAKHVETSHVQIKSPGEEYPCFWINCTRKSKPFPTRQCLLVHLRSHTGEKPYKCADCNKVCSQLGHLKIHQMRHKGKRTYWCQFSSCSKRFSTAYDRDYHQATHHNTVYACQVTDCSEKYAVDDELEVKQKSIEDELKENDFIIYHL